MIYNFEGISTLETYFATLVNDRNYSRLMVSKKGHEGETIYTCDACGFGYRERGTAERCEDWCTKYKSCSIEITKDAVYYPEPTT